MADFAEISQGTLNYLPRLSVVFNMTEYLIKFLEIWSTICKLIALMSLTAGMIELNLCDQVYTRNNNLKQNNNLILGIASEKDNS